MPSTVYSIPLLPRTSPKVRKGSSSASPQRCPGRAAGALGTRIANTRPSPAMAANTNPGAGPPAKWSASHPPRICPSTMAAKVVMLTTPLARERSASPTISPIQPYLAGPKKVLCTPSRHSSAMSQVWWPVSSAHVTPSMSVSSTSLQPMSTALLRQRSATRPAQPASTTNGSAKSACASVCSRFSRAVSPAAQPVMSPSSRNL
jgi:hypothetical protein